MYLRKTDYDNITADITSQTSTKIIGKIDLADTTPDSYDVCVVDCSVPLNVICGLRS